MTSFLVMRTDKVTEFLNRWMMRSFVLMLTVTVLLLTPRVMAAGATMATPPCETGTHQTAGQCTPDPAPVAQRATAPVASSLDYATESVLIVEGQDPDATPVVKVTFPNGAQIWIPEEDPSGGHVTPMWLDDSPLYSGGWLLQVSDDPRWLDVHERLTLNDDETTDTDQYGAGAGAVCGTDAQCAAWSRAQGEEPSGYAAGKG